MSGVIRWDIKYREDKSIDKQINRYVADYLFICLSVTFYKPFYSPLFEPEAFHTGNYTEITQDFYKQKSPREEAECLVIAKIQNNR